MIKEKEMEYIFFKKGILYRRIKNGLRNGKGILYGNVIKKGNWINDEFVGKEK